jgi:hypothetical protein
MRHTTRTVPLSAVQDANLELLAQVRPATAVSTTAGALPLYQWAGPSESSSGCTARHIPRAAHRPRCPPRRPPPPPDSR